MCWGIYFKIKINYDVDSNPPRTNKEEIQIKWFPSRINLSNYYQNEIDQINVYTYEVNEAIASGKTKEEVINNPSGYGCRRDFLYGSKFVVFKPQATAHIDVIRQKRQRHLGFYAGVVILDGGIVSENIDHCAEHIASYENRPRISGGGIFVLD